MIVTLLEELRAVDSEFPLQYALCLLYIAGQEGLSPSHLSEKTGLALSTVSRIIGALSTHRQRGKAFELIEVRFSPNSRRNKELYLSKKGKALIQRLCNHIGV